MNDTALIPPPQKKNFNKESLEVKSNEVTLCSIIQIFLNFKNFNLTNKV